MRKLEEEVRTIPSVSSSTENGSSTPGTSTHITHAETRPTLVFTIIRGAGEMIVGKRDSDSPRGAFLGDLSSAVRSNNKSCRSMNVREVIWISRNIDGKSAPQQGERSTESIDGQSDSVTSTEVEPTDRTGGLDCAVRLEICMEANVERNKNACDVIDDPFPSQAQWTGFTVALLGSQEAVAPLKTTLNL